MGSHGNFHTSFLSTICFDQKINGIRFTTFLTQKSQKEKNNKNTKKNEFIDPKIFLKKRNFVNIISEAEASNSDAYQIRLMCTTKLTNT